MMKIWVDIKNSHEPLFFRSVFSKFKNYDYTVTCRNFAEIPSLLDKYNIDNQIIGGRTEGHLFKRRTGFFWRVLQLITNVEKYDVSLSHYSGWAIFASKIRGKKNIVFNEMKNLFFCS